MTSVDNQATVLALRMWRSLLATQELLSAYLGVRLGLYEELAAKGPATPPQLAERAGVDARYAREWLEQQAVAGLLTVPGGADVPADERVYTLPAGHADVLTVSDNPMSMAALAVLPLGGVAAALPRLLDAYRTGAGVPDDVYGLDWREGHAGANRAVFARQLPGWLAGYLPDVHAMLGQPGCRAADVACGSGWSSLALARTYPGLRVDGLDLDADAIAQGRQLAQDAGLAERVSFAVRDAADTAGDPDLAGGYHLVCLFDALHEMSCPVEVLRACRALRAPQGTVLVMDAKVAPTFMAPGDEVERFQYGTSVLHCLPASRTDPESGGTGTVLRPDAVRALATEAGFAAVTVLPVEDRFHRLYRLIG
jgi:SAM-dependent methyltransferase